MSKVAIVTDSTSTIPQDRVTKYNISVAPQVVIWNGETYRDGIEISASDFYTRLGKAVADNTAMPTTSQCSIKNFTEIFQDLHSKGYDILCVLISSGLSGTINSATQAKEQVPDATIEIIDTKNLAMSLGHMVQKAAEMAATGSSLAECKAAVEALIPNAGLFITPETLEYLHRGGRIGGGAKFLATALNIKPILKLEDGKLEASEKVRTRKKVLRKLIELVQAEVAGKPNVRLSVLHANSENDANVLVGMLKKSIEHTDLVVSEVSPAIGVHTGPGTVGITFVTD